MKRNEFKTISCNTDRMITVCVIYNYNSFFQLSLSPDATFRSLFRTLPVLLKRQASDLLYLICDGKIVGQNPEELDRTLSTCGLTEHRCTVHLIFKIPENKYRYTHNDLLASHNAQHYPSAASDQDSQAQIRTLLLQEVLRGVGVGVGMYDVDVHIDPSQLQDITTEIDALNDDLCAMCQTAMTNNVLMIRSCRHKFHRECITEWLTSFSVLCPLCNQDVRENL
jgi:hypothetical protein